jgi:hypothetical protein
MPGSIIMINEKEEERYLNNSELRIDRGFEIMLRNQKRREKPLPKTFSINFGNIIFLFSKEIEFEFNFYINVKKR